MSTVRVRGGDTERIQTPAVKGGDLAALTGLATVVLAIQRTSDGFWLDFNDSTFKASGWTTRQQAMTEVSATLAPGEYRYDWTAPAGANAYMLRIDETGGTAKNVPFVGEIKVDPWASPADVDALETHGDANWATATGFETEASAATREATNTAEHATTLAAVNALAFATPADLAALEAALEAYGDANWATAVGFATSAALAALEAHGDGAWATATGFETEAAAATREATNTAEHAATLAAVGLVPTVGEIDAELTANHGAGSWIEGSLDPTEALHLAEIWTALGLNLAAPASFDSAALFVRALAAGIDIAISVVGTTVTLTRQP